MALPFGVLLWLVSFAVAVLSATHGIGAGLACLSVGIMLAVDDFIRGQR